MMDGVVVANELSSGTTAESMSDCMSNCRVGHIELRCICEHDEHIDWSYWEIKTPSNSVAVLLLAHTRCA